MTYYITAPNGDLIETEKDGPAPANWVFSIMPELSAFPQPSIHLVRTRNNYTKELGNDILDKFKKTIPQIKQIPQLIMREGIIPGLEVLVTKNDRIHTIYTDYIEKQHSEKPASPAASA